jgi:cell division protein FtsB
VTLIVTIGNSFLFLNINILILYYAIMQSEIDSPVSFKPLSEIDSLKQRISELEAENNIIKAENIKLKAKVVKLEDKQTQNELIKNLLSVS